MPHERPLTAHLEWLLDRVSPEGLERVRRSAEHIRFSVYVRGRDHSDGYVVDLPVPLLIRLGQLGIELDFDAYYAEADHA